MGMLAGRLSLRQGCAERNGTSGVAGGSESRSRHGGGSFELMERPRAPRRDRAAKKAGGVAAESLFGSSSESALRRRRSRRTRRGDQANLRVARCGGVVDSNWRL